MITDFFSAELKRTEREADYSPPSNVRLKMSGLIPPFPSYVCLAYNGKFFSVSLGFHMLGTRVFLQKFPDFFLNISFDEIV